MIPVYTKLYRKIREAKLDERFVEKCREECYEYVTGHLNNLRHETKSRRILNMRSEGNIKEIKESLRQAKRPRMRKAEYYICDECDKPVFDKEQGFIIHGNIYKADPSCRSGLIGNNFPSVGYGEKIEVDDVKQTVLCLNCFKKAIGLEKKPEPIKLKKKYVPDCDFIRPT